MLSERDKDKKTEQVYNDPYPVKRDGVKKGYRSLTFMKTYKIPLFCPIGEMNLHRRKKYRVFP